MFLRWSLLSPLSELIILIVFGKGWNILSIKENDIKTDIKHKLQQENGFKTLKGKETDIKTSYAKLDSIILMSDSNTDT